MITSEMEERCEMNVQNTRAIIHVTGLKSENLFWTYFTLTIVTKREKEKIKCSFIKQYSWKSPLVNINPFAVRF